MGNALIEFVVLIAAIVIFRERLQRRSFTAARWHAHPGDRWKMVHDLIRTAELRGMNRSEVIAMLGTPEYESDCSMAYWLTGDLSGDKLRIRLGTDGRVFKSKLEMGC